LAKERTELEPKMQSLPPASDVDPPEKQEPIEQAAPVPSQIRALNKPTLLVFFVAASILAAVWFLGVRRQHELQATQKLPDAAAQDR
jgi:hypothetical protein